MTAAEFARIIKQARKHGSYWNGLCPAHDDTTPSLAWKDGAKGLVLKCHRSCSFEDIAKALQLSPNGFFYDEAGPAPSLIERTAPRRSADMPPPPGAKKPRAATGPRTLVASYDYEDLDGTLLFQVQRYEPKDFPQRKPDGKGGWLYDLGDVKRVPYHWSRLTGATRIYFPEGEGKVERLEQIGLVATTSPHGAKGFKPQYATLVVQVSGRGEIVVLPDNDEAGRAYADTVARAFLPLGCTVKVLPLPGLAEKGDIKDWLDAGGTKDQLEAMADQVPPMVDGPVVESIGDAYHVVQPPASLMFRNLTNHHDGPSTTIEARLDGTTMADYAFLGLLKKRAIGDLAKNLDRTLPMVEAAGWEPFLRRACTLVYEAMLEGPPVFELQTRPPTVDAWLIEGLIPMDEITLLYADGGSLKSWWSLALAVAARRGEPLAMTLNWCVRKVSSVLYIDWETDKKTHESRLHRLCAGLGIENPGKIYYMNLKGRPLHLSLQAIATRQAQVGAELLFIDSLGLACGDEPESAQANLRTLGALSSLRGTKIVLTHVNAQTAIAPTGPGRPYGSVYARNVVRSAIEARSEVLGKVEGRHTVLVTYHHRKANDAPELDPQALTWRFEGLTGPVTVDTGAPDLTHANLSSRLLEALTPPARKTLAALAIETGSTEPVVRTALARLEKRSMVDQVGESLGGRGKKGEWIRIDENHSTREY